MLIGIGKGMKMSRGPFFFFFFFFVLVTFFETTEICLGLPKWKFLLGKEHFKPGKNREKIRKSIRKILTD